MSMQNLQMVLAAGYHRENIGRDAEFVLLSSYFTPPPPERVTLAPLILSLCLSTLCIKSISISRSAHLYSLLRGALIGPNRNQNILLL